MRKTTHFVPALLALGMLGTLTFSSCSSDDNIDLNEIDTHIGVGSQNFSLPTSSTHDMVLEDLLDIDDSDCIETDEDGNYRFFKKGEDLKKAYPKVDIIDMAVKNTMNFDVVVDMAASARGQMRAPNRKDVGGKMQEFQFSGDATSVKKMEWAKTNSMILMKIWFNSNLRGIIHEFKDMSIVLPTFTEVEVDPTISTQNYQVRYDADGTRIVLGDVTTNSYFENHPIIVLANIKLLKDFQTTDPVGAEDYLKCLNERVNMKATVNVEAWFDKNDVNPGGGNPSDCRIQSNVTMDDFKILEAHGYFDPEIDLGEIGDVEITDVPDFLDDDEVSVELDNPYIVFAVNNNIDIWGKLTSATINSYKKKNDKSSPMGTVVVNDIDVHPSSVTKILLCNRKDADIEAVAKAIDDPVGSDKDTIHVEIKEVSNLSDLIKSIPELITIDVDVKANSDKIGTFVLGNNTGYRIIPDYEVIAPLSLGTNSKIVYKDTFDGWNEDLKDVDLYGDAVITLVADVRNETPLELDVEAHALNEQGNYIDDKLKITVTTNQANNKIASHYGKPGTDTTQLTIKLSKMPNVTDAFKILDGLQFRASATPSAAGIKLNKDTQKLKLTNIKVSIQGTVSYDVDN